MHIPLLNDVVIIFALSVGVLLICHKLKIPAVVGYLATGIIAGPYGLAVISKVHEVDVLAEIGIVLLLFAIGIEFSFRHLLKLKKSVLLGGFLQVFLTIVAFFFLEKAQGLSFKESLLMGILISFSSTAIVLKLIQERAEMDTPHGQTTFGILIFQDLIIVPMMLFIPFLSGGSINVGSTLGLLFLKGLFIVIFVYTATKWLVPYLLFQITKTRLKELFLLSIFAICLLIVWLTSSIGLSLALGAFLAGLIISESEYSHEALGNILPFKDVFMSFFFISIGMLLDVNFFLSSPFKILGLTFGLILLKAFIAGIVTLILGYPLRTGIMVGVALSQVGEFSFILVKTGLNLNILSMDSYQTFLAVAILSMSTTAFILTFAPKMSDLLLRFPFPKKWKRDLQIVSGKKWTKKKDHLIIVGFGLNGRNLARAAEKSGILYTVVETNPETVKEEKTKGTDIYFGDAANEAVLHHLNIDDARIVVIAISDPRATRRIVKTIRSINPLVYIIVRTRYLKELKDLFALGASEVVPEEFETSIEIFTKVLIKYLVPQDEIEKFINEIRFDNYEMFRSAAKKPAEPIGIHDFLSEIKINSLTINKNNKMTGKTLAELRLNKVYSVTILAVKRQGEMLALIDGSTTIQTSDTLVILGKPKNMQYLVDEYF
ncbi:MAG: cation:proton antiporter [Spirochaetia bacterium]|nr:cation:proton antiporter [Spirochaetia bacterium]